MSQNAPPHNPNNGPLTDAQLAENRAWHAKDLLLRRIRVMLEGQPWTREWSGEPVPDDHKELAAQWVRERPPAIQELLRRFPPKCLVRTREGFSYGTPGDGMVGIVVSYNEGDDADGPLLGVIAEPESGLVCHCVASRMELVQPFRDLTPEWVEQTLAHET